LNLQPTENSLMWDHGMFSVCVHKESPRVRGDSFFRWIGLVSFWLHLDGRQHESSVPTRVFCSLRLDGASSSACRKRCPCAFALLRAAIPIPNRTQYQSASAHFNNCLTSNLKQAPIRPPPNGGIKRPHVEYDLTIDTCGFAPATLQFTGGGGRFMPPPPKAFPEQ
jgi:hypothetical protein